MADKEIGKLVINIEARLNNLEKGLKTAEARVNQSNTKMISSFNSLAGAMGITFGTTALIGFAKKSINAYAEQEKANKKLETALGRTSKALLDNAAAIQFQSTFTDEQIIEANARFAMYIKDEKMIKLLTDRTRDFAVAQGMDLVSASDMVIRTLMGQQNALGRLKININGAAGSQERFNSLTKEMNRLWSGHDLSAASTKAGELANQLKKLDEIGEDLGKKLLPILVDFGEKIQNMTKERPIVDIILGDDLNALMRLLGLKTGKKSLKNTADELKKDRAAIDKMMNGKIFTTGGPKELTDEEKKALEEREAKQAEFYNQVKFLSDKYYKWQLAQIEKEKKEFIAAGISKIDAEKLADQKLFELELQRFNEFRDLQPKGLELQPFTISQPTVMEKIKEDYQIKLDLETEFQAKLRQIREDAEITNIELMESAYDSMTRGFDIALNKMITIEHESNSILIQGFVSLANSFIAEVNRMIAKWIAFQFIKGIIGLAFAPVTGGASLAVAATPAGMPSSPSSFVVNPALEYGGINKNDIQNVITVIKAMNMNLANRIENAGITIINNAPDVRTTVVRNKKVENRIISESKNLSER